MGVTTLDYVPHYEAVPNQLLLCKAILCWYYKGILWYENNSVKRSDVTRNRFEWELGDNKVI